MQLGFGLALLASSAQALVAETRDDGSFSVAAIAARGATFDIANERRRLMTKFETRDVNDYNHKQRRQAGAEAKHSGSVPVVFDQDSSSFQCPTMIGNQTFNMIFDTGSADLWVFSDKSPVNQNRGHVTYTPSSTSERLPNYSWAIKYSGGVSANGTVYTDTVRAGSVVAEKQAIQAALSVPYDIDSDGILGLASGGINTVQPVKQTTLFETLLPTLPRRLFAANLRSDAPGSWDFGFLNESLYTGDIHYSQVILPFKHWKVMGGRYSVADGPLSAANATLGPLIVDSGSQLIYLPQSAVDAYYATVPGFKWSFGGVSEFPCNTTLPDFHFQVGDQTLTIPGSNLNLGTVDRFNNLCSGVITGLLNLKYAILGNTFMKNYYVVHSYEDEVPKLGFGVRK
ncbi:hypothetical protein E4U21_002958 [Claviceps maximensis]|nr:hypothetical protein E4U21_002958 [Claviceps maximensis]